MDDLRSNAKDGPQAGTASRLRIAERHSLALRWMHWINFPVMMIMAWSGLMVYWITAVDNGVYDHQTYRVGVGSFTLFRLFPDWFYHLFRIDGHLTRGHALHSFFMWPFVLNGVAYVVYLAASGRWRAVMATGRDLAGLGPAVWRAVRKRDVLLPGEKYSGAQRVAYTVVIALGVLEVWSGVAIWKPTTMPWFATALGGYQAARWIHFWCTMSFCGFLTVHVLQVLRAGWSTLRSMVTGFEVEQEPAGSVQQGAAGSMGPASGAVYGD